jgi:pilus assembly protein Flp/PilA
MSNLSWLEGIVTDPDEATAPLERSMLGETGASLVEYALLLALIAVISIGAITLVGQNAEATFDCVGIELGDPEIRHTVIEKQKAGSQALSVIEEKFAADCL